MTARYEVHIEGGPKDRPWYRGPSRVVALAKAEERLPWVSGEVRVVDRKTGRTLHRMQGEIPPMGE